jgi:hypothetical protein
MGWPTRWLPKAFASLRSRRDSPQRRRDGTAPEVRDVSGRVDQGAHGEAGHRGQARASSLAARCRRPSARCHRRGWRAYGNLDVYRLLFADEPSCLVARAGAHGVSFHMLIQLVQHDVGKHRRNDACRGRLAHPRVRAVVWDRVTQRFCSRDEGRRELDEKLRGMGPGSEGECERVGRRCSDAAGRGPDGVERR